MNSASTLVRRLVDHSDAVRRVVKSDAGQAVVRTQRAARAVDRPGRFAIRQVRGQKAPLTYALRAHRDIRIVVRHRSRDVDMLNEIFGGTAGVHAYALPSSIAPLPPQPSILDLGANVGLFALYARAAWGAAHVHSFEPDPANFAALEQARSANRAGEFDWRATKSAVSNRDGVMAFSAGHSADSHLLEQADEDSIEVPLLDVFSLDHRVDLAKIDIEGGEWAVLGDQRFTEFGASRVVLEWHAHLCPSTDPHATARRLLANAGYEIAVDRPSDSMRNGLIWAQR